MRVPFRWMTPAIARGVYESIVDDGMKRDGEVVDEVGRTRRTA